MSSLALSFVGTLQYIAPELFLSQTYSKSVDYWSLGFITHEIVTGHRPFLPNMSPGQWMEHVQTKSLEDICIYQDVFTGKITKSRTFFPEHQLDGSVAEELQVWLRSLLKWDSNNRGKDEHGQVCVFSQLGDILSKIRIQVVSMDFGIHGLDFVVGEASTGQDLQQHVERASGLAPANQLILGSSGCEIHASHALHPIFDRTSEDCRVFVFDRLQVRKDPGQQIRCLKLSIPTSIQPFLAKPRLEVTYPEKKLIYSHAVHFTKQENQMSHLFGLGLKVLVLYLLNKTKEVNVASQIVGKTFERVSAKVELFQESLFHDKEKYLEQSKRKDHITSAQIFDSWHTAERDVAHHVSRLNETKLMADNLLKNVNILAVDVQKSKSELMQQQEDMNLQDFVDKSILRFESLKKIPVEGRKEKDSVMEVAQIIVKCLKQRDRNLQRHFCLRGKLFEMYAALQTLQPEQTMAQQVMESVSNMVSKLQRKRQSDIWKLLAAAVQQKEASPVTTSNAMAGKMFEAFQEASKVVANQNDSLRRQLADMTEQANPYLNPL